MSRYSRSIRPCSSPIRSNSNPHSRSSVCTCDSTHDSHGRRSHGFSCSDLCHPSGGCCPAKILTEDSTAPYHSPHGGCNHGQMMATCVTTWNSPPPCYNDVAAINVWPNSMYIASGCPSMAVSSCTQQTANIALPCPALIHQSGVDTHASKMCASQNFGPGPSCSPQTVSPCTDASPPVFVVVPSQQQPTCLLSQQQPTCLADSNRLKGSIKPMSVSAPKGAQDDFTYAIMPPGYYPYLIPKTSKKSKRKSSDKSESWKSKEESSSSEETSDSDDSSDSNDSNDSSNSSSSESTSEDSSERRRRHH